MAAPAAEPQDSTGVIPVPISLLVLPCFSWKESCMCGQRGPRDGLVAGLRRIGMTCFVHLCHRELFFCNFTVLGVKRSVSLQSPASIIILKFFLDMWKGSTLQLRQAALIVLKPFAEMQPTEQFDAPS